MASHSEQVKPLTEHPGALRPVELGGKKMKTDTKKVSTDQKGFRFLEYCDALFSKGLK